MLKYCYTYISENMSFVTKEKTLQLEWKFKKNAIFPENLLLNIILVEKKKEHKFRNTK